MCRLRVARFVGIAGCLVLAGWAAQSSAGIRVMFDSDEYVVNGPGETITARISLDADDSTPEPDPLANGLFSFGTLVTFSASDAIVMDLNHITVDSTLDNFGISAGAFKHFDGISAGAKGNVQQLPIAVPYEGTELFQLTLVNQAAGPTTYPLGLQLFRTLGAAEQIFNDGAGTTLDMGVEYGIIDKKGAWFTYKGERYQGRDAFRDDSG